MRGGAPEEGRDDDPGRALAAALRLLGGRDYLTGELDLRLRRKGFSPAAVEAAVARCRELGLLDDAKVAARFAEARARTRAWGPARVRAELERRGATREEAAAAARAASPDGDDTLRAALARLERRAPPGWWRLPARRARMVSSLVGRGFAAGDAVRVVGERAAQREEEDDACDDQPGDPVDLS
jgi:regulatory protein